MPLLLPKDFIHTFLSNPHRQYLNPLRSHTDHPQKRPKRAGRNMQLSQTPTKILQAAFPGWGSHGFVSDIRGFYF